MNYVLAIIIGIMLASIINLFVYPDDKNRLIIKRILGDYRCALTQAVLIAVSILLYSAYGLSILYASYIILSFILSMSAIVDIQKHKIPDTLIIISLFTGIAMVFINPERTVLNAVLGALTAGGILLFVSVISKGSLGIGDVKLFASVGLFLGVENVLSAMLISIILSGVAGLILIIKSVSNRKKAMPFAPFIFLGTFAAILM